MAFPLRAIAAAFRQTGFAVLTLLLLLSRLLSAWRITVECSALDVEGSDVILRATAASTRFGKGVCHADHQEESEAD